ncbi:methyltransferase domain-containing protein [Jiella sp. M17.18]|uniref:class I SAM-dependent methyltransferase n=1 Tax=Jiella sp. M17.18 TaxID=3234247 RepID=UPI0034DF9745
MNYAHTPWSNLFNLLPAHVTRGQQTPEFDHQFYRLVHEDMRDWSAGELEDHFKHHGIREGRIGSACAHRLGFIASFPEQGSFLEIGPFTKPALSGRNVKYFDVLDKQKLLERAEAVGYPTTSCPDIDFVSATGDMGIIDEQFDYVFSSHCIEHQPDLITHLKEVGRILKDNGKYFLIVPDKRYCFDFPLPASSLDKVIRAFDEKRKVHTLQSIIEHYAMTTHSDALRHWQGDHEDANLASRFDRVGAAIEALNLSQSGYVDVHSWQFTPESFRRLISELEACEYIGLSVSRVYETVWGQYEFCAVLAKN